MDPESCSKPEMLPYCQRYCKLCDDSNEKLSLNSISSKPKSCKDQNPLLCSLRQASCSTDDMVRKSCPKTCGYCIPGSNTNECIDRNPTLCPMRVSDCENVEVRSSCKFTCNACSEEPNKIAPVPISTQRPATAAPTTQRDSKSTAKKCLDQQPSLCPVIKADCQHSEVKAICAYTCGICSGSSQLIESSRRRSPEVYSPKELCRDWNVLCPRAERECDGNQFVQTLCPYTCGTC